MTGFERRVLNVALQVMQDLGRRPGRYRSLESVDG
jgi:hypothetical protein